jgi:hypothetical protein
MTYTVANHAEVIRRRLFAGSLGRYDILNGTINSSVTSLTVTDGSTGYVVGLKIGIDSEIMLIRSYDPAAKTVTVLRGFLGTTAASHTDQTIVEIAPRFPLVDVTDTMREEIESWGSSLFTVKTAAFNTTTDLRAYNLTGALRPVFILEAVQTNSVSTSTENSRSYLPVEMIRDVATADFASGFAVQFKKRPPTSQPVFVTWAEQINTANWATSLDLTAAVPTGLGLDQGWLDIVTYGTLWRLMSGKEIGRTDLQASGDTRRGEEVPPLYTARAADQFRAIRDLRLANETNELRSRYPYRVQGM